MKFSEVVEQAGALLQRKGRMTYRALKLEFALDEEHFEALKEELLYAHSQVTDDEGRGLVWTGKASEVKCPGSESKLSLPLTLDTRP